MQNERPAQLQALTRVHCQAPAPRPVRGWLYRALAVLLLLAPMRAPAQVAPEPYVDDSTLAAETLAQLDDLLRAGSKADAARAIQALLDEHADRLVASPDDPSLFRPVRLAAEEALLAHPELLETYIAQQEPAARALVDRGRHDAAEHTRLLTPSGFEAALRVAQEQLELAHFEAAWRTLAQLDRNPLITDPPHAADAAKLAASLASLLDRPAPRETAQRWARNAGLDPVPIPPAERPPDAEAGDRPALAPFGPANLDGVVPTPLQSIVLPAATGWAQAADRDTGPRALWSFPILLDNEVFINDGEAVLALDRFTLRQLWRVPEPAREPDFDDLGTSQRQRNRTRLIEDPSTVTAHDRVVLAPLGSIVSGRHEGDPRLICLDRETGAPRWAIDPGEISPETVDASIRGPVMVDQDTAVILLRKNERTRRIIGVSLAGLRLTDGALRWIRPIGSVGALPYQQQTRIAQAVAVEHGVAYVTDEIGLTAAIEVDTGRPVWIRRTGGLADMSAQPNPWAVHQPIPDGDAVIAISPDRSTVQRLDAATGRELAARPTRQAGTDVYLLDTPGHPETAALVGESRVVFLDKATLTPADIRPIDVTAAYGAFTGRIAAAGDRLLAPVESGVLLISPGSDLELVPLDSTGNIAAAPGQILIADDTRLRSYLAWGVASAMLKQRIENSPADPGPAITYAELAFRAGHHEEVLPAVDLALAAIDRAGPTEPSRRATDRLFDASLGMIDKAHEQWFDQPNAPDRASRADADAIVPGLIDRLGRIADSPAQRVAYAFALGRQHEASGRPQAAAAAYQGLLADPLLATTSWRGPRMSVRAELEAERRLHALVRLAGFGVYAPFDREARDRYRSLQGAPDPVALDEIARRYPLSPVAAMARLDAARDLADTGEQRQAISEGAKAVEILHRLSLDGAKVEADVLGNAYGAQIVALARANRFEEAGALAAEAAEYRPQLVLRDGDRPIEVDALFGQIKQRLAGRRLKPRIGLAVVPEDEPQLVKGYPLRPLVRAEPGGADRARFDGVLFVSQDDGTLAWFAPASDGGPLAPAWSRLIEGKPDPLLLRIDEVSAWVFWPTQTGGWLERIALEDGSPMWVSANWESLIQGVPPPDGDDQEGRARFVDPIEGRVRADELLLTMDSRTIILVERGGRAAAVDAASGDLLWAAALPLLRVHDVDTTNAVFAMGGVGKDRDGNFGPMLATLDPRTGEPIHVDDRTPSEVRWTRVTAAGDLIAGLRDRIVSVSPNEGRTNFEIANPQTVETNDAWISGDTLVLRSLDDRVWVADARTGRLRDTPLDTQGRLNTADRVVFDTVGDGFLLAATDGVCVYNNAGDPVGIDGFIQPARFLPAAVAENALAMLKIERGRFGLGGTQFILNLMDPATARVLDTYTLRLFGEPNTIDAIDNHLLINAGELTVVLHVPTDSDTP
ncbi:MAG: PQQ-binding-like beta-propeller repeat protein [Phycisphaeraceae bacterium]|nr:MAG: PQQ-binding-like beta-propeller repeat protein [Phycisphaeraceae bacterium]